MGIVKVLRGNCCTVVYTKVNVLDNNNNNNKINSKKIIIKYGTIVVACENIGILFPNNIKY